MSKSAEHVFQEADKESEIVYDYIREAAEWFHRCEGEMLTREEAKIALQEELGIGNETANKLIGELVGDKVDPVVQVKTDEGRFVGVAEYREFEGAYGYLDYNDVIGEQKKVVCARCVEKAEHDEQVKTVKSDKTSYEELVEEIHRHYQEKHKKKPEEIETGATLAAGTTIAGSISWHAGNDGYGSGLTSDKIGTTSGSDPSNPSNGTIWLRTDL